MIIAIIGIVIGVLIGFVLPMAISIEYSLYMTLIILVAIDAILGAIYSYYKGNFNNNVFVVELLSNELFSIFLVFIGQQLGLPLYYVPLFVFGFKMYEKMALIRNFLLKR